MKTAEDIWARIDAIKARNLAIDTEAHEHWMKLMKKPIALTVEDLDAPSSQLAARWSCTKDAIYAAKDRVRKRELKSAA